MPQLVSTFGQNDVVAGGSPFVRQDTIGGTNYLLAGTQATGHFNLLIYTLGPDGLPDPASKQTYFTGTDPVSLTATTPTNDLNHDTVLDVLVTIRLGDRDHRQAFNGVDGSPLPAPAMGGRG